MKHFAIIHPLITEKATDLGHAGQYVFLVKPRATKPEIKKAVRETYKVDVENVHVINVKPKQRRLGASAGVKSGYKKAIVTLKKGQKLDILPH